ncbi:DUF72 domain-containing protein [Cereibacter sphaeroides]|uniref:DUF72 domain-containing protein n=1 Tax=Cereibacter sphaeroides TaxID=1063 RepID=UPI001F2D055A|nr:DUF72 domain-containing protein [Cereibacter sphaeroides]MCE6960003.1 DUF72 domain-containing protein [Cereibacter sphaeroides]MCE6968546.1 DUF72 domain-containing protein [Cereibacter sphaeroides]MCE6973088.1 DUF72 domain-containing protein [Cereibacter sphaeroides]
MIRVGVGGWVFEPWRGTFYPEGLPQKRELEHAGRIFTTLEINGTYYGSQKPESFRRWHDEVPEGFVFTLKAPRFATNRKRLSEAGPSITRFLDSGILELKDKLGPINWQFLPTKRFEPDDFAAFLALLPLEHGGRRLRHAVELRHESFRDPALIAMTRERGIAVVTAGDSEHPQIADATADFAYVRIMGTRPEEPEGYPAADLDRWAERARALAVGDAPADLDCVAAGTPQATGPRDVFLFVISGHKPANPAAAQALLRRVG